MSGYQCLDHWLPVTTIAVEDTARYRPAQVITTLIGRTTLNQDSMADERCSGYGRSMPRLVQTLHSPRLFKVVADHCARFVIERNAAGPPSTRTAPSMSRSSGGTLGHPQSFFL